MKVIYMMSFPEKNQKAYIGMTKKGLERRILQHINNADTYRNKSPYIENAIRKYKDFLKYEILMICDYDWELPLWEIAYIEEYNTKAPSGYNLTAGGDIGTVGYKHTEDFKTTKSQQMRKNHVDKGLEPYVKWKKTKKGTEGYIFTRPGFKSAQFCSPIMTMEEKLLKANEHARAAALGNQIDINRYKHIDIGYENIPVGISYLSSFDGFRVTPPGKPTKWFKSKKLTRDQKYQKALNYYNEK